MIEKCPVCLSSLHKESEVLSQLCDDCTFEETLHLKVAEEAGELLNSMLGEEYSPLDLILPSA